jgi:uncharacterized protein (TIGR03083 family)
MSNQEVVDKMEMVWSSIAGLARTFSETDWKTPTDCPGWSVQDQVSHLTGSESRLLGRPAPDHTPVDLSHLKNDIGRSNEVLVDWRRSWPGAKVLEEFLEVTGERLRILKGLSDEEFQAETQTPVGPGTVTDLIGIRIFDAWAHEQDIRRAVGQPGHLEGPVAEHSVERVARTTPYVVGRKVQPPDGTTVVFEVTGPAGRSLAITMQGARANPLDDLPSSPTVTLSMDVETFVCLGCGRWDPEYALRSGKVQVHGDDSLGRTIVAQMNIMV